MFIIYVRTWIEFKTISTFCVLDLISRFYKAIDACNHPRIRSSTTPINVCQEKFVDFSNCKLWLKHGCSDVTDETTRLRNLLNFKHFLICNKVIISLFIKQVIVLSKNEIHPKKLNIYLFIYWAMESYTISLIYPICLHIHIRIFVKF